MVIQLVESLQGVLLLKSASRVAAYPDSIALLFKEWANCPAHCVRL